MEQKIESERVFDKDTDDVQKDFERSNKIVKKFRQEMKKMDLKNYVLNQLNPPTEKHIIKGHHKDIYTGLPPRTVSLYDGIKYK